MKTPKGEKRRETIEEEAFLITRSGEIPEVAYHSSLHYLQEDSDGPGLRLTREERLILKEAVIERYRFIILRDLNPKNRKKRIYRGIKRSIINYNRLSSFAQREGLEIGHITHEVREALAEFLETEIRECGERPKESSINCSFEEIEEFWKALGLERTQLPEALRPLCRQEQD